MKRIVVLLLTALLCALLLPGCTVGKEAPDAFLYDPPAAPWEGEAPQDVIGLLEAAGHRVTLTSTQPSILHGQRYHMELNGDKLHAVAVYQYESAEAARIEADCIGVDGYSFTFPLNDTEVSHTEVNWVDQPHFYLDGERILLYIGHDTVLLHALEEAYGAPFAGAEVAASCGTE